MRSGNAAMLSASTTCPPMANTSLQALAAAIAPKSAGSSTSGGKKSVVDTIARSSEILNTAASSKGASPTSRSAPPAEADIDLTSTASGEPPHSAAQPRQGVHAVSRSAARGSTRCEDAKRVGGRGVGTKVQVRTGFNRAWASGFEVVEDDGEGYLLRRLSDGRTLPRGF